MINKLKKYLNFSLLVSSILMILGIIIFIYPEMTLKLLSYIVSTILIIFGISLIIEDLKYKNIYLLFDFTQLGIINLLLGIILLMYPNLLTTLIPIFLGIWFITAGIMKIKITTLLKQKNTIFITSLIMSILSIICGTIFIISPLSSANAIISSFGILLFIYSLSDIIDMIIFRKNIKDLEKTITNDLNIKIN